MRRLVQTVVQFRTYSSRYSAPSSRSTSRSRLSRFRSRENSRSFRDRRHPADHVKINPPAPLAIARLRRRHQVMILPRLDNVLVNQPHFRSGEVASAAGLSAPTLATFAELAALATTPSAAPRLAASTTLPAPRTATPRISRPHRIAELAPTRKHPASNPLDPAYPIMRSLN